VAFPSFHTAFAIICVYTVRHSLPALFGVGALNVLMLLSIPTFGGHYLTDMIGGGVVAFASILSIERLNKRGEANRRIANRSAGYVVAPS
jgi:membrane-associated phospholipid phosphatase